MLEKVGALQRHADDHVGLREREAAGESEDSRLPKYESTGWKFSPDMSTHDDPNSPTQTLHGTLFQPREPRSVCLQVTEWRVRLPAGFLQ